MIKEYYYKGKDIVSRWWNLNWRFVRTESEKRKIYRYKSHDIDSLHDKVLQEASPCFVLSTGRAGTALLTKILAENKELLVEHNPIPELTYHSGFAYKYHKTKPEICKAMIDAARYEYVRNAFILDKMFIETNSRVTFFAYQLAELYPKARFIHLVRNPESFIRSGLARNWYHEGRIRDEGKIKPEGLKGWENWSQADKIAWLWQETNNFIEDFKKQLDDNRILTVRSEDLFENAEVSNQIINFLGMKPLSNSVVKKIIRKPVNKELGVSKELASEFDINIIPLKQKYYS